MHLCGLCGPVPAQNVNFAANCNCRALNIVLGEPKLEFGWNGINSALPAGVGARDPA